MSYTNEELIQMGKKFIEQREKDKQRQRIYSRAAQMVVQNHKEEYNKIVEHLYKQEEK